MMDKNVNRVYYVYPIVDLYHIGGYKIYTTEAID